MANIVLRNAAGENVTYKGITSIIFNTDDGSTVEFIEGSRTYVLGKYTEYTLTLDKWNGTTYTLTTTDYLNVVDAQLGIPPNSSLDNAQTIIHSCLTIANIENNESNTVFTIGAVKAPTKDVTIAIWRSTSA